jgi:hypothetical protein
MEELNRRLGILPTAFRTSQSHLNPPFGTRKNLVLFMHGLGGDAQSTWGNFPALLLQNQDIAAKCDVAYYRFPTSLFRIPFSRRAPKIQELAAGLRSQIENTYADYSAIALVCHSLGGLIARRYIIEEVKDNRLLRIRRLALFSVPNNGAALASIGQFISWRHGQLKQLCRDADVIEFMNEDWIRYNIQSKLVTKFIIGTQDRVVDRFSVAGYWGNPDVETVTGKGHVDIVKPVAEDDLSVIILRRFIQSMLAGTDETKNSPKPISSLAEGI